MEKNTMSSIHLTKKTPEEYVRKLGSACKKCNHCCSFSSGFFLDEDIVRISKIMNLDKSEFIDKFLVEKEAFNKKVYGAKLIRKDDNRPYGKCVFLDDKEGCTIHEFKPLHCVVGSGCSEYGEQLYHWYVLNYLVNPEDPESIRQWASTLTVTETIPGGNLHELVPDKQKLKDILSYKILR